MLYTIYCTLGLEADVSLRNQLVEELRNRFLYAVGQAIFAGELVHILVPAEVVLVGGQTERTAAGKNVLHRVIRRRRCPLNAVHGAAAQSFWVPGSMGASAPQRPHENAASTAAIFCGRLAVVLQDGEEGVDPLGAALGRVAAELGDGHSDLMLFDKREEIFPPDKVHHLGLGAVGAQVGRVAPPVVAVVVASAGDGRGK